MGDTVTVLLCVAVAVAWYWPAGVLTVRYVRCDGSQDEQFARFVFWLFTPLAAVVAAVALVLWPVSGGVVSPPWRWKL